MLKWLLLLNTKIFKRGCNNNFGTEQNGLLHIVDHRLDREGHALGEGDLEVVAVVEGLE